MLIVCPSVYQKRPQTVRPKKATPPPPPAVPVLVAATYDPSNSVVLTFDRPIDIDGLDVTTILVNDGDLMDCKYAGWPDPPPELTGPATVLVYLNGVADDGDPGVRLTVGAGNGIAAAGGGGAWAGVSELPLPFGS